MPTVTSTHNAQHVCRVFINDTLHLAFPTDQLAGVQSWIVSTREPVFCAIELTVGRSRPILVEYDNKETWCAVLAEISKALGSQSKADARHDVGGAI